MSSSEDPRIRSIVVDIDDSNWASHRVGPYIDEILEEFTCSRCWPNLARDLLAAESSEYFKQAFRTYWIVAGHRIRKQLMSDRLLAKLLRRLLAPYCGQAVVLYRGENAMDFDRGRIGFAWTPKVDVAKMFGRGLNSSPGGGVLLTGHFPQGAIISGPDSHSLYLGEHQFTVDPFAGVAYEVLERDPEAD